MTIQELLVKARAIQSEYGHAKQAYDRHGRICMQASLIMAECNCSFEQLVNYDYHSEDYGWRGAEALGFDSVWSMCAWNNSPATTEADVLACFDTAIEAIGSPKTEGRHLQPVGASIE